MGIDETQNIAIMFYLQDISIQYLDKTGNNPVIALNRLVVYFLDNLSVNGKKYDRVSIKFYLVNEMIRCGVFSNDRSEYDDSEQQYFKIVCLAYWLSHTKEHYPNWKRSIEKSLLRELENRSTEIRVNGEQ